MDTNEKATDFSCLPILAPETVYFSRNLFDDLTIISKIGEDYLEKD